MNKNRLFGVIMIAAMAWTWVSAVQAADYFRDSFDSGKLDLGKWQTDDDSRTAVRVKEVGARDFALEIDGTGGKQVRVYSVTGLPRGQALRCDFRVWRLRGNGSATLVGPWHHTSEPEGLGSTENSTIEAGLLATIDEDDASVKWAEAGNCTMGYPGPLLDNEFTAALKAATSKESSLLIRIELGDFTGGRGRYSDDNGGTWRSIRTFDGAEADTVGLAAVSRWKGIRVSSHPYGYAGFVVNGGLWYIDDVTVSGDRSAVSPVIPAEHYANAEEIITSNMGVPAGRYYEATVPDTLDLAERGALMVQGLTNYVNPKQHYVTFGQCYFNVNPPYMTQINGSEGHCCWTKSIEALLKARVMSGSDYRLDIQRKMLQGMLKKEIVMNPTAQNPWLPRALMAFSFLYQMNPTPKLREMLSSWVDMQASQVYEKDNYAFFDRSPPATEETVLGVLGEWRVAFIHGTVIRELVNWHRIKGSPEALELAGKVRHFLQQPQFWQSEAAPRVVVPSERAWFMGHHHSFTTALMGLLWYAEETHDVRLTEFVRSGYEYMRNFGLARIGLFAEMCTAGDMTQLALKLSELGVGDYWDDADSYLRNQMAEMQVTDADKLRSAVAQMPPNERDIHPIFETADNVIERNVGCYLSDASHPTLVRQRTMVWTVCCNGNCTPALYYAWDAAVRSRAGWVQVNLLMNRASPWLDVDSYLPYEGRVVLRNKTASRIAVRLPKWVERSEVKLSRDGTPLPFQWLDRKLIIPAAEPGDTFTIRFPVKKTVEVYTLKWKESDFWYESTNPGWNWQPDPEPTKFTCTFKGNTLVDIHPRSPAPGYPLYQRDFMRDSETAPMKKVRRFVPDKWPKVY